MYTSRILLVTIAGFAVLSGAASVPLRRAAETVEATEAPEATVEVAESQVDSFFEEVKAMIKSLLGMGEEEAAVEETSAEDDVNPCEGAKIEAENVPCMVEGITAVLEQAGANVTEGYHGDLDTGDRAPITQNYADAGLCPVNVHWHLGAEHLSVGEFDEYGMGPEGEHRELSEDARLGFRCHYYDEADPKFTTEYAWEHCVGMHVGETYEIHWPHSAAGACGTKWQYQEPFYDGVFCNLPVETFVTLTPENIAAAVGVQAQVFTIVNDEAYYHDNLFAGMIVDGDMGADITAYTGSTTGETRDNEICSQYSPITWQVDRKCHLISASSFDKMCADMLTQNDDMTDDLYAHGSRELVADYIAANNQQNLRA